MVSFLILVCYLFRLGTQPAKPSTTIVFTMKLHVFTHQKNVNLYDFHDLFRYQIRHRFLSFGIDLGSVLASFWHRTPCLFAIVFVFDDLMNLNPIHFVSEIAPKSIATENSFRFRFRSCPTGHFVESSLAHFGTLLAPPW